MVERGSFVTIIGPSGCGKSTLLHIMGGLTSASTGAVYLDDEKIDRPRPDKIGMVFQEPGLYPWRTALKNVEFGLEIKGVPREERIANGRKYLQLVGLSGFEGYYPKQLSGGMQQRVGIARALALDTEVLLMDEPFGALDEQTRLVLGAELTRIWEATKKTIRVCYSQSCRSRVSIGQDCCDVWPPEWHFGCHTCGCDSTEGSRR